MTSPNGRTTRRHPRAAYLAISHSIIGEAVFDRVLRASQADSVGGADPDRFTLLMGRVASPNAIDDVINLATPRPSRLAAVYDRAEELLRDSATPPRRQQRTPGAERGAT